MPITIRKALELKEMKPCRLVAGVSGLERVITGVNTMEIPDISAWLKKGVLLLTTGYAIQNDPAALLKLIDDLHQAEAAGLAMKSRFIGRLPDEAKQKADELGLPLIIMPEDLPFPEFFNALIAATIDEQNMILAFSHSIHERFMQLEITGGGYREIASATQQLLGRPVMLTDRFSKPLAQSPEDFVFPVSAETASACVTRKVSFKGKTCAWILVYGAEPMDELNDVVLDYAAQTIALEYSKREALNRQINALHSSFFADLLMGRIKNEEEASMRAKQLGWSKPPFLLFQLELKKSDAATLELSASLEEQVGGIIKNMVKESALLTTYDAITVIMKTDDAGNGAKYLPAIAAAVAREIGGQATIGVSTPANCYLDIQRAGKEASDALKIARALDMPLASIVDFRLEQAVMHMDEKGPLRVFARENITPLYDYDKKHGSELVKTLRALVDCMGVRTSAAEKLYLHRNTLLARIRKIETITGTDLSRAKDLMNLAIALRVAPFL